MFSFSFSIPRPITCFHSMTKNFTSLCLVSVYQSQVPLHVSIVWQKTSLHCAQFQFFNPKSHYMYPMDYRVFNSIQPFMQKPHIKFMCESTLEEDGLTLGILFTTTTICTPLISHGALPVEHLQWATKLFAYFFALTRSLNTDSKKNLKNLKIL